MTGQTLLTRTNVYIDGYNLYHGCFDNPDERMHWRSYRWLDVNALCQNFCPIGSIRRIRYFTALTDSLPSGNADGQNRQLLYWRALRTIPCLTIHQGLFATNAKWRPMAVIGAARPTVQLPIKKAYIVEREEKGSDVNLASYLLLDAFRQEFDLAIVISNDSDLAEPIRLVRSEFGARVCIVNPRKKLARGLKGIADDYRTIRFEMVKSSQFPPVLTDATGSFTKPQRWT